MVSTYAISHDGTYVTTINIIICQNISFFLIKILGNLWLEDWNEKMKKHFLSILKW
jgi:hypothetical protein